MVEKSRSYLKDEIRSDDGALTRPPPAPFLASATSLTAEEIRAHPETTWLHERLRDITRGTSVLKVKIYSIDGRNMYPSEARQIGEDKSRNGGVVAARGGTAATEITQAICRSNRPAPGRTDAVLEAYDDITPFLSNIERTQRTVVLGVLLVLGLLYGVLPRP